MRLAIFILMLLVATVASAGQIGTGLKPIGPGYVVYLDSSDAVGEYLIGEAPAVSSIEFTRTLAFNGTLYACDRTTIDAACDLVGSLNVTQSVPGYQTAKRYFVLDILASETFTAVSTLMVFGTDMRVSDVGGGAPPPPVEPPDTTPPPDPTNLVATPGDTSVSLAWDPSHAFDHDSWVLEYELDSAPGWLPVSPAPAKEDLSAAQSGLVNDSLYNFRLQDCDEVPNCSTGYATDSATPTESAASSIWDEMLWDTGVWG